MDEITATLLAAHGAIVKDTEGTELRLLRLWAEALRRAGAMDALDGWDDRRAEAAVALRARVRSAAEDFRPRAVLAAQRSYQHAEDTHRQWLDDLGKALGAVLGAFVVRSAALVKQFDAYVRMKMVGGNEVWDTSVTRRVVEARLTRLGIDSATAFRTLLMASLREQNRRAYGRIPGVRGYRRLAAKSQRTCAACLALDGKFYGINEVMEEHPNGRCQLVPVTDAYAPTWTSGREWFEAQPEEVQRHILGPGRWKAWREGRLLWEDIPVVTMTEYGPSVGVIRVRDLPVNKAGDAAIL